MQAAPPGAAGYWSTSARGRPAPRRARPRAVSARFAVVVPDRFDVVAVGVVDERGVVARPVVAIAGAAVVSAAGVERRAVKRLDLLAALRFERDVQRHDGVLARDPE